MKNKKMNLNQKKKCIYIKNIYISKNPKLNNSINSYFENKKLISDYNVNKKDPSTTTKQVQKKSVKPVYQNIYSQKGKYLIKGNQNFLSTKNIHIKSPKKEIIDDQNLFEPYVESISGRKSGQKKYDITNPFKERSNSESSLNYFNRTNTFYANKNKDNNKENLNDKNNKDNNINKDNNKKNLNTNNSSITISSKINNELKINLSSINFNKNIYNIKNNIKQNKKGNNNNTISEHNSYMKKNGTNTTITRKSSKKYIYRDQALKKTANPKLFSPHHYIDLEKEKDKDNKDKDIINMINSTETISSQVNILSPNLSSGSNDNIQDNMNSLKNSKRIQKYILSDKKRKTKSRQNLREYKCKEGKSKSICPEPKKQNGISPKKNNEMENKLVKHKSNAVIYGENGKLLNKAKIKIINKENEDKVYYNNNNYNNNYDNNYQMSPRYYYEKDSSSMETFQDINKNGFLFEHSAIIIQSVFRGYLVKSKLETNLFNYKFYNKAVDILENLYFNFLKTKANIDEDKNLFMRNLLKITKSKNIKSTKSCKTFKLINIPTSPLTELDGASFQNKFIDLYLHKEIGERFNILKQNSNREKELEKKHKEELENVNNKIIKLIKENNILKNINQKNKINESKYKELSLENKKKENIINIITNDNQNLAKKLKVLKDKINQLEIQNPTELYIFPDTINKIYLNKFNTIKEVLEAYRNLYLFFLIKRKETLNKEIIRKYFNKYKNNVYILKYEDKINSETKEKKLNCLLLNIENKKNQIINNSFNKIFYISLLDKKDIEYKNDLIKAKLRNIIIKKEKINKMKLKYYFKSFYNKIFFSKLIEEKSKIIEDKKNTNLKILKKIITSIEARNNKFLSLQYKNYFIKWKLTSKILSMKAVVDEKKRKKRQKQRTKRKIEKKKSVNKLFLSSSISQSQNVNSEKNSSINTLFKEKIIGKKKEKNLEKEKDNINYLEHTVTTDFSLAETNPEIKTDKIIKGTEKLNDLFLKAMIFYKILGNKNNEINLGINKENINNINNIDNKTDKEKKEIKTGNESDNDEDSGESSFGL